MPHTVLCSYCSRCQDPATITTHEQECRTVLLCEFPHFARTLAVPDAILARPCLYLPNGQNDQWSCGFRNIAMLVSSLGREDTYRDIFKTVPAVEQIQQDIESGWAEGWDQEGREQLQRLKGTRKWIGSTEVIVYLGHHGVEGQLIDSPTLAGRAVDHSRLYNHILDYFRAAPSLTRPVLYLQHQGHSRTVVGVAGADLLLFDPALPATVPKRLSAADLRHRDYSLVQVQGLHTPGTVHAVLSSVRL
ncbi:hypothetical protein HDU91_005387 [Kappamyces sp. JEL0680]|nr:hypothetical protein HDU91_005387 [Kappamyces sp. JEL0680]